MHLIVTKHPFLFHLHLLIFEIYQIKTQFNKGNLKNVPTPGSFSFIFGLFKQRIQCLQQMNVKNVHLVNGAGI